MIKNHQKQVWEIEFDADQVMWDKLGSHINQLKHIISISQIDLKYEASNLVMPADSLIDSLNAFKEKCDKFKGDDL